MHAATMLGAGVLTGGIVSAVVARREPEQHVAVALGGGAVALASTVAGLASRGNAATLAATAGASLIGGGVMLGAIGVGVLAKALD